MRQYDDNDTITLIPDVHLIHDTGTRKGEITDQPKTHVSTSRDPCHPATSSPSPTTDKPAPCRHPTPSPVHKSHLHPVHQSSCPHTDRNRQTTSRSSYVCPHQQHQKNTDTSTARNPGSSQPIHTEIKTGTAIGADGRHIRDPPRAVWRGCCRGDGFV